MIARHDNPEYLDIFAGASSPRITEYRENNGDFAGERTLENLLKWAASKGLRIPDFCEVVPYPEGDRVCFGEIEVPAMYCSFVYVGPQDRIFWNNKDKPFRSLANPVSGKVRINIDSNIMKTDEEFLHVLAHEVREIQLVKQYLDECGSAGMPAETFGVHVSPSVRGNAHDEAWEFADAMIEELRKKYDSRKK